MENNCSILSKSKSIYTCLTKQELVSILNSYNIFFNTNYNISQNKKDIYKLLKKLLKNNEVLWYNNKFIQNDKDLFIKLKCMIYKPLKSTYINGYLDTDQINQVMYQFTQYINKYNNKFIFYGTKPSNHFEKNKNDLISLKKQLKLNIPIGIIFNTDIKGTTGSHWVSVYITKDSIYYFDSIGNNPNKHLSTFISSINIGHNKKKLIVNDRVYQHVDGLCGIYSIEFLLMKIFNKPIDSINDKIIFSKKKEYFR